MNRNQIRCKNKLFNHNSLPHTLTICKKYLCNNKIGHYYKQLLITRLLSI